MRADEYTGLSALQIAAAVNSRELSAVEVAEVALAVAEQRDQYGAFTCLAPERAMADARRTDQRVTGEARATRLLNA